MNVEIVYEDDWLLAAVKPPGCPSQPDKTGDEDLLSELMAYLKNNSKSNYLAIINRLDRPVGGIVLFGKTPKAAAALSKIMTDGLIHKEYLAVVTGIPQCDKGELTDYILKNGKTNVSVIVNKNVPGAKLAKLQYRVLATNNVNEYAVSLVVVRLFTGRHHQIRVQLANAGTGIWGDKKYNPGIGQVFGRTEAALWACRLTLTHPFTKQCIQVTKLPMSYPFSEFNLKNCFDI